MPFNDMMDTMLAGGKHLFKSVDDVAAGFLRVAVEAMARPVRAICAAKGLDPRKHTLACFGGAGGQVISISLFICACLSQPIRWPALLPNVWA